MHAHALGVSQRSVTHETVVAVVGIAQNQIGRIRAESYKPTIRIDGHGVTAEAIRRRARTVNTNHFGRADGSVPNEHLYCAVSYIEGKVVCSGTERHVATVIANSGIKQK